MCFQLIPPTNSKKDNNPYSLVVWASIIAIMITVLALVVRRFTKSKKSVFVPPRV